MGKCVCNTQCSGNSNCGLHYGCPTYSDPVDSGSISFPPRPEVGDNIDSELLNELTTILNASAFNDFSATQLPPEVLSPIRPAGNTKRRVDSSNNALTGQPLPYNNVINAGNELVEGDYIVPERAGVNYPLDYNGLISYMSNLFKYTADGATITYLEDTDPVAQDDRVDLVLLQRLWDSVQATVTDCVCNYDRCNCNSVCACNIQCSCNVDY